MRHLNYGHLQYFWVVAREGSIARAAEVLHVTPQTISGQLKLLDEAVGERLFRKAGRRLVLSRTGQMVFEYADEIFNLGAELAQVVRGRRPDVPRHLNVGIVDSIPKLVACRIIAPALEAEDAPRIRCQEGTLDRLLGELAVHRLDLVLSDQPLPAGLNVKAYSYVLGESGTSFFVSEALYARYQGDFPALLDGAPMLLPGQGTALRRRLEEWFEANNLVPVVAAEFDDSALLKAFGEAGAGAFAGPTAIADEICRTYGTRVIGSTEEVRERFYAISPERRLKHASVVAITEAAREQLFGADGP
ncbi:MAG TPA: transcriptional activator NhaR [Woeseiaceae bacterium]|nr:transcriptional activator NhaR [Woeseiaceae bacterium]